MNAAREVIWRRSSDNLSFELARMEFLQSGATLSGTVLAAESGAPLRVEYRINCDPAWRTLSAHIEQGFNGVRTRMELDHDGAGAWTVNGESAPHLAGCTDIDLGVTPSTNALAINRLGLAVGATGEICAAWIRFPALDIVSARQSYTRLSGRDYRYHSLTSGFEATLTVDEDGLPVDYAQIWKRIAATPGPEPDQ